MKKTHAKIWIHTFFSTNECLPIINADLEKYLYENVSAVLKDTYKSELKIMNGTENHTHILFQLNQNSALKDIIKSIKGETSYKINHNNLIDSKFSWQLGYSAYSVSESILDKVEKYISDQKEIHKKLKYKDECLLYLKKHGLTP